MAKNKQDRLIKRYQLEHLVPLAITIVSFCFWFNYFNISLIKIIGLIVNIVGLFIWWAAKLTLGNNWSAGYGKPRIKKLITTGIYSRIRHPLYLGINLTLIGLAILYLHIWFIVTVLFIVFYFFRRMHVETIYLELALGNKYKLYENKTWF